MTEKLDMELDIEVGEHNKHWRKWGKVNRVEAVLSMLVMYTQVENELGLR